MFAVIQAGRLAEVDVRKRHVQQHRAFETRVNQFGAMENGSRKGGVGEVCATQVRSAEVRELEEPVRQVSSPEVRQAEMGVDYYRMAQVRIRRFAPARSARLRSASLRFAPDRLASVKSASAPRTSA